MIERRQEIDTLHGLLKRHPAVGIIGARQVGKTTLARLFVKECRQQSSYFDMENPEDLARVNRDILCDYVFLYI